MRMFPSCDFDQDGGCGLSDIDALVAMIASGDNNVAFDLTGDGLVNLADRDAWLAAAGARRIWEAASPIYWVTPIWTALWTSPI